MFQAVNVFSAKLVVKGKSACTEADVRSGTHCSIGEGANNLKIGIRSNRVVIIGKCWLIGFSSGEGDRDWGRVRHTKVGKYTLEVLQLVNGQSLAAMLWHTWMPRIHIGVPRSEVLKHELMAF